MNNSRFLRIIALLLGLCAALFSGAFLAANFKKTASQGIESNTSNQNKKIPAELLYQGKPIDALCIDKLIENSENKKVELSQCSKEIKKYKVEDDEDQELEKKGFIGLSYTTKDRTEGPWGGYAYYKYLGKHGNNHIIYFLQNTGGSGMLTYIFLVQKEGDTLTLKDTLVSGDRCNGGIEQAQFENNQLLYTLNTTPYDFIALSKEDVKLEPYDDLANCAICCQGSADFSHDFKNYNLIAVNLGDMPDASGSLQGKYQLCFDRLISDYIKKGKQRFTVEELKQFVREFKDQCMK